ncbi:MAG: bifunctional 5,10-methylenetetrahydrofolate dehydrogenase/5,10-methenyltetrahydrofolate cyclohydrolase [Planctomycetota bacterium]
MSEAHTPRLLDGKDLAERVREKFRPRLEALVEQGQRPRLVVVEVGENQAARSYIRGQRRGADSWGIEYDLRTLPASTDEKGVRRVLRELAADPRVTGVLLAMPLPAGLGARSLQQGIKPSKDVEGVHPENLGGCLYGSYRLLPCTALAVMALLEDADVDLRGKEVVVVGHSEIVGKPAALLLLARDATVTVCHKDTQDLAAHTRKADVLVVAVGKPGLIRADMVKDGVIVVDVGINAIPDADNPGKMRLVGDVDYEGVAPKAAAITPVPGGVGPVTVAMLLRNTVLAAEGMPPPDDPSQLPLFRF